MANTIYNAGISDLLKAASTWDSAAVHKAMLERSTSTYVVNKDHDGLDDLIATGGFVEITVTGYARVTLGTKTITIDNTNDEVELDCADLAFGTLASGQTVKSIVIFKDGASDAARIPLLYIDTDTGALLPRALGGGTFTVQINANGLLAVKQQ